MKIKIILFVVGIFFIPSLVFASTIFRIDMDANTPGVQTGISVMAGQNFTSNIEVVLDSNADSLIAFGVSIWWDVAELSTPAAGDISTTPLGDEWIDLSYFGIASPFILNFTQLKHDSSSGPLTATLATIDWTVLNPVSDGVVDLTIGFFSPFDEAFAADNSSVTPIFQGGKVSLVNQPDPDPSPLPEPAAMLLLGSGLLGLIGVKQKFQK